MIEVKMQLISEIQEYNGTKISDQLGSYTELKYSVFLIYRIKYLKTAYVDKYVSIYKCHISLNSFTF